MHVRARCVSWVVVAVVLLMAGAEGAFSGAVGQRQLARGLRLHQLTDSSDSPVSPGHMHIGWSQQQQPVTAVRPHCSACCVELHVKLTQQQPKKVILTPLCVVCSTIQPQANM